MPVVMSEWLAMYIIPTQGERYTYHFKRIILIMLYICGKLRWTHIVIAYYHTPKLMARAWDNDLMEQTALASCIWKISATAPATQRWSRAKKLAS